MIQKSTKLNPFTAGFINIVINALPNLHNCPITGHFEVLNFTTNGELFRYVSKGVYRISFHIYNDFDEIILWISYIFAKTSGGGSS